MTFGSPFAAMQFAIDNLIEYWQLVPTSCADGGEWAWQKRRQSGAWEMVGCACHHAPPTVVEVRAWAEKRRFAGSEEGP